MSTTCTDTSAPEKPDLAAYLLRFLNNRHLFPCVKVNDGSIRDNQSIFLISEYKRPSFRVNFGFLIYLGMVACTRLQVAQGLEYSKGIFDIV